MAAQQLETLFNNYIKAFSSYDLDAVIACHHFPCTLHTPDKIVLINTIDDCKQEFNDIFTQLKQANTTKIIARMASYLPIKDGLLLVCIDWDFIDNQGQVFTDFCAYYHISTLNNDEQKLSIVNVVSHELSNSLSLENALSING